MGRGSDRVGPWDQQSPVVSSMSCGDVVLDPLHTDGGIWYTCAISNVRNGALNASVNLQRPQRTASNTKLSNIQVKGQQ